MRTYVRLNKQSIVDSEMQSEGWKGDLPADMMDVTGRVDGPWVGKFYDARTDTFTEPVKPPDVRPIAHILLYYPGDSPRVHRTVFQVNEQIGIDVTIKDEAGNILTDFAGDYAIPIMTWNPVLGKFEGPVRRLGLSFRGGFASREFNGFETSGDYGVDEWASSLARVSEPIIVTVIE